MEEKSYLYENIMIDEFLEIKDEDLKKYIFSHGNVKNEVRLFTINNDVKIGFYLCNIDVKQNAKGVFYKNSVLTSYIVYDKKEKKVKTKNVTYNLEKYFLESYFVNYMIVKKFCFSLTKTLIKLIVTEKIKTISDIMNYHKSYTFKNKNIDNKNLYYLFISENASMAYSIKDLDDKSLSYDEIVKFCKEISPRFGSVKAYQFSVREQDIKTKIDEWAVTQSVKYGKFLRSRIEKFSGKSV